MKPKMEPNTGSLAVIGVDIGKEVFHLVGLGVDRKIGSPQRTADLVGGGRWFRVAEGPEG